MNNRYKLRSTLILVLFLLVFSAIAFNLYRLQIMQHVFFTQLGEKQYKVMVTSYPPRAPIYDRSGKQFLAMNKESSAAFILPKVLTAPDQLKPFLKRNFPHAYERLASAQGNNFMYIARRLTPDQIDVIEKSNLVDIKFLSEPGRFYPVDSAAGVVGITDIDNRGIFGLELLKNKQLSGKSTTRALLKDARSGRFYFDKETMVSGESGEPLILSLDSDLQFLVHDALQHSMEEHGAQEGSALIMNPKNGEILAMVNFPSFDPNDTRILDMDLTKNRIISDAYELGSVIKVFAALASLQEGVIKPDDLIDCEGVKTTYVDGRKVNTVPSSVLDVATFSQVIEKSNNIGIAKVVKEIGPRLYDHYLRLGFGRKTGIEFPQEHEGFVNPPHNWSKQSILSLSYGYEITATLLQLATAFSLIANGGYAVRPTLLLTGQRIKVGPEQLYDTWVIEAMKNILENTVVQGSAQKARIHGYRVMGKTGTANLLINGEYSTTKNIYTFAGIVEKDSYQRVIVTFIKEVKKRGVYASTIAAPLFEAIAEKMLIHDKII